MLEILLSGLENGEDHEKTEKYLKICIKACPQDKRDSVLFKLGHYYLKIKKDGNAKACFSKYLDINKNPGGLSWYCLGTDNLI